MNRVISILSCSLFVVMCQFATAQDYTITTTGDSIVITDILSGNDTITVSENGTNIRFAIAGRDYSLNGGATTPFPVDIPLSNVDSIKINAGAGADAFDIGAFTATLPKLIVNGGPGNDAINFNGSITFATDADLNVHLQNDAVSPGTDSIRVTAGVLELTGTGSVIMTASRNIVFSANTQLSTED